MTAGREELLRSIRPDMQLTKNFFLRIYGYDITTPGFAEKALTRMQILGCSKARNYYNCIVAAEEHEHQKAMKAGAEWLSKEIEKEFRQKEGGYRWQENKASLLRKKKELLMMRSQGLTQS